MTTRVNSNNDYFQHGSLIRRVGREWALVAGGGAAVVLQAAHPVVARGVWAFSRFRDEPFQRLFRTLSAVYALTFGTQAEVSALSEKMVSMHRRIAGPEFSGLDPDAQYWVLATLIRASLDGYERIYGPLSDPDKTAYYHDMLRFGACFGLNTDPYPQDIAAFETYYHQMLSDPILGSDPVCREVIQHIVYPKQPWYFRWLMPMGRFLIVEQVPDGLHDRLGLKRTRFTQWSWELFERIVPLIRFLPARLRWVPHYFRAEKRGQSESV